MWFLLVTCLLLAPLTGRAADIPVDHERPLFSRQGIPMCRNEAALKDLMEHVVAGEKNIPNGKYDCRYAVDGLPVSILESDGIIDRWDKVMVTGTDGRSFDAWTLDRALRN